MLRDLFQTFAVEKRYLSNISPRTFSGYQIAWKALEGVLPSTLEELNASAIKSAVVALASRGLSPVSVNVYLRVLNTFLHWLHTEGRMVEMLKASRLKEPQSVLPTFTAQQIRLLMNAKPSGENSRRAQAAALVVLDTGLRGRELTGLRRADIDLENLLLKVNGKGSKQRIVPFSTEGRKILWRWITSHPADVLWPTSSGRMVSYRNLSRDFAYLCNSLGITGVRCSFHTLRHTFAVNYVRSGGDPFRLQRILGHTTLEMTKRYVHLQTEDLSSVHDRYSVLQTGR
jgi:integrase/recombinase XerD